MTTKQRLIDALTARGWTIDPEHKTRKYVVMKLPIPTPRFPSTARYFVGDMGALRFSSAGSVTGALPHDATKAILLGEASSASEWKKS